MLQSFSQRAKDKSFWQKVRTDKRYKFFVDDLLNMYNKFAKGEITEISYDSFMQYHKTGKRTEYEQECYFPRRQRMNACAMLALIYPENEEYIKNLQNTIWAICNEYCWSLPPHTPNVGTEYNDCYIDLFAAETGFALSEIRFILGERMDVLINNRIHAEIEKRIIQSFLNNSYWFEVAPNNWTAVCATSVGATFMYERPDLFYSIKPRLDATFERFFESFYDDGACREGVAYWGYGFGFFTAYAQLLGEFSNGEINLLESEKVKKIAEFPSYVFLNDKVTISFSDGDPKGKIPIGTYSMLKEYYGDIIEDHPFDHFHIGDHCGRWCYHIRALIYFDPETDFSYHPSEKTYFLKDSAWFVKKGKNYCFAAKGGNNDEPHNHNDIGSFIAADGEKQILCDIGCGEYTKDYFLPEKRYTIFCNRSLGHGVPLLDGKEQATGKEYYGTMDYKNDILSIDMTKSYEKCNVESVVRCFSFEETKILLTDYFKYKNPCPITERFVTFIKPEVSDGKVFLDNSVLKFDSEKWNINIGSEIHITHLNPTPKTVYTIDFLPKNYGEEKFCLEINI